MSGKAIPDLHLSPLADAGARVILARYPFLAFTSGKRNIAQQAHAMACNVVVNRSWIRQTYLRAASLQTVVDLHPEARTVETLEYLLRETMATLTYEELYGISRHFTGDAWDARWIEGEEGEAIAADCWQLPGVEKVLTDEAGVRLFHVQFYPSSWL